MTPKDSKRQMSQKHHRQFPEIKLPVPFIQRLLDLTIDKNNYKQVRSLINTNKIKKRDKDTLGSILHNIISSQEFISKELSFIIDYDRLLADITISPGTYLHSYETTIIKEEDILQIISYGYTCVQSQETTDAKIQYFLYADFWKVYGRFRSNPLFRKLMNAIRLINEVGE